MLEIAVFGKVSAGKSALLNAVFDTAAFIVDARAGSTTDLKKVNVSLSGYNLIVVDTPGINDIAGTIRTEKANHAAESADLVIFVCDSDLTEIEYLAVTTIASLGKPLLIVLNKSDTLNEVEKTVLPRQLRSRLSNLVDESHILVCAADPTTHYMRIFKDGSIEEYEEKSTPDVIEIRKMILNILENETKSLQQLNQIVLQTQASDAHLNRSNQRAKSLIDDYALGVAVGVAINPIPLIDVLGSGAAIIILIGKLAECYSIQIRDDEVRNLATLIVGEGWKQLWVTAIPIIGGSLLKSLPLIGWAMGAIGQAVGGYYITYVMGETCAAYFAANKQWVLPLQETIKQIIANTDTKSVTSRAAIRIRERLRELGK